MTRFALFLSIFLLPVAARAADENPFASLSLLEKPGQLHLDARIEASPPYLLEIFRNLQTGDLENVLTLEVNGQPLHGTLKNQELNTGNETGSGNFHLLYRLPETLYSLRLEWRRFPEKSRESHIEVSLQTAGSSLVETISRQNPVFDWTVSELASGNLETRLEPDYAAVQKEGLGVLIRIGLIILLVVILLIIRKRIQKRSMIRQQRRLRR